MHAEGKRERTCTKENNTLLVIYLMPRTFFIDCLVNYCLQTLIEHTHTPGEHTLLVDLPLNSTLRKYLSKSAPLVGFMASQSDGRPPHKSRCMSLWGLAQLKRAFFGYECHTLRVRVCVWLAYLKA